MKTIQDHYFKKARKEGFAARSAFKLKEINQKFKIIKSGNRVLDLGCFPGSWMQYISLVIGDKGLVIGIDRTKLIIPIRENMRFVQSDINDIDFSAHKSFVDCYDAICSDMAPNTTGIKNVDSERSLQLCQTALLIAQHKLRRRGSTLVKILRGGSFERLLHQMREEYKTVKIIKPKSSRSESKEVFVLGVNKK